MHISFPPVIFFHAFHDGLKPYLTLQIGCKGRFAKVLSHIAIDVRFACINISDLTKWGYTKQMNSVV